MLGVSLYSAAVMLEVVMRLVAHSAYGMTYLVPFASTRIILQWEAGSSASLLMGGAIA